MEIKEIEKIEPKEILSWFKKICKIPHGSYHEEQISKWLASQCKRLGCEVKVYPSGMILAKQKATKGCGKWPTVLLQSHMDMVLVKTSDCKKNLVKQAIQPYYDPDDGQIKAKETSLGADDGIGVAIQLAIMSNKDIVHGPIEHLFTVNEEDRAGKCVLDDMHLGDLDAKYYINIDGHSFSELIYGSCGCSTLVYDNPLEWIPNKSKINAYNVTFSGLVGGHSGMYITRPHINPIVFLAQCIIDFAEENNCEIPIFKFDGGPINNSLPMFAKVNLLMTKDNFDKFQTFVNNQLAIVKKVAQNQEENALISFQNIERPGQVYSWETSKRILLFASLAPNKVFTLKMNSYDMYSSSNLGFICIDHGKLEMDFKVRSFIYKDIERIVRRITSLGKLLGFTKCSEASKLYSFINDITKNHLAEVWNIAYQQIIGKPIKFVSVPGGLECASICLKNPKMIPNTICVNTTLQNCHSATESLNVADTIKFWEIIKLALAKLKD